jgi:hypothetical protein
MTLRPAGVARQVHGRPVAAGGKGSTSAASLNRKGARAMKKVTIRQCPV